MIELKLLTKSDVEDLHPRLRLADKTETVVLGSNPREALIMGFFDNMFSFSKGRAYGLWDHECLIGAIGFTASGHLWALCTEFTYKQRRELVARTFQITISLLWEAWKKGALSSDLCFVNIIHKRNSAAMRWLKRSGIYEIDEGDPLEANGEVFYPFKSKPLSELLQCAFHF